MMAPFAKNPLHIVLKGITNDSTDPSVDLLRTVTLPLLKRFGLEDGLELKVCVYARGVCVCVSVSACLCVCLCVCACVHRSQRTPAHCAQGDHKRLHGPLCGPPAHGHAAVAQEVRGWRMASS